MRPRQKIQPHRPESPIYQRRFKTLHTIAGISFLLLITRFWYLQIFRGEDYREFSVRNSVRTLVHYAPRGQILDRNGEILVDNRPQFNVTLLPKPEMIEKTLPLLSKILQLPPAELLKRIDEKRARNPFLPIPLKEDITWEELVKLEARKSDLPGVWIEWKPIRSYPLGAISPHVLGYVGEIDEQELRQARKEHPKRYRLGDPIGKSGVESIYERLLKGVDGGRQILVDAMGRPVLAHPGEESTPYRSLISLQETAAIPGNNIRLTIDLSLQKRAQELLEGKQGVLIVMDVPTGEILALASEPHYDPELFARGMTPEEWKQLREDPRHPLENKAIRGLYPPGSTFKVVVAAAALGEGILTPEEKILCTGGYSIGRRRFRCWKQGGHGVVNLERAIIESCDVFFYRLGELLGVDKIAEYAKKFGLDRTTGIDLYGERSGLIPTRAWKEEQFGDPWYPGDTASVVIGQGYILMTPLQILSLYNTIANGGKWVRPHLLKSVQKRNGEIETLPPQPSHSVGISQEHLALLKKALYEVVHDPKGTGRGSFLKEVAIAGKTGTAQVISQRKGQNRHATAIKDHAWFAGFAPAEEPQISVVALVEHGGHGGAVAAPLAKAIIGEYFETVH